MENNMSAGTDNILARLTEQRNVQVEQFKNSLNPLQEEVWKKVIGGIGKQVEQTAMQGGDLTGILAQYGINNPAQQQSQPNFADRLGAGLMAGGMGLQGKDPSGVLKNLMGGSNLSVKDDPNAILARMIQSLNSPAPEGYEVAGTDQTYGNPIYRKKDLSPLEKASQRISGTAAAESQLVKGKADILTELFMDAREEAKAVFPDIGKTDLSGKAGGFAAKKAGMLNKLPTVIAYQARKKAFATTIAKAAGEVRPTDEDINRFMESLPDLSLPDETNNRLLETMYTELESQGAKNVWDKFSKASKEPTTQKTNETDRYKVGDVYEKDGKVYTYQGNGQWSY